MPFSIDGMEVFFYTLAATAFVLAVVYIVRRRRSHFHYQAAHNLDDEEVSFATEMTSRTHTSTASSSRTPQRTPRGDYKQRDDELFDDEHSADTTTGGMTAAVDDIEFDRDELDQLRMLSAVRAVNNRAPQLSQSAAAALIDDSDESDDEEEKKEAAMDVVIDMPASTAMRVQAISQPTQPPLPSPHRLQHRQSAAAQQKNSGGGGGGQSMDKAGMMDEERKEADVSAVSRADRHERAVV